MFIGKYLSKAELTHGMYYEGSCRNASYARWNSNLQEFTHWRTKFSSTFLETISHPEDEEKYDVFYPVRVLELNDVEKEIPFG